LTFRFKEQKMNKKAGALLPLPETTAPLLCEVRTYQRIPVYQCPVPAGFPSPAEDYLDRPLDFNELLIAHPAATFAVRVSGESMIGLGIFPGDIAVIDRALTAQNGSVILAVLEGAFTIKILRRKGERLWLEAANPAYKPVEINEASQFEIWGVVRHAIRMLGA
jgi:DNA polymerase V